MSGVRAIVAAVAALLVLALPAVAEQGSQGTLTALAGGGSGRVLIAPTAQEHGEFYAQGEVEIEGATPAVAMAVTRALFSDATCGTITKGWAPVPPGSLTTDASGSGSMHFVRDTPLLSGTTFYTEFRVSGGSTLLQSDCIAVYVK